MVLGPQGLTSRCRKSVCRKPDVSSRCTSPAAMACGMAAVAPMILPYMAPYGRGNSRSPSVRNARKGSTQGCQVVRGLGETSRWGTHKTRETRWGGGRDCWARRPQSRLTCHGIGGERHSSELKLCIWRACCKCNTAYAVRHDGAEWAEWQYRQTHVGGGRGQVQSGGVGCGCTHERSNLVTM